MATILRKFSGYEISTLESWNACKTTGSWGFWTPRAVSIYVASVGIEESYSLFFTRMPALGDTWLKLPPIFSQRVLLDFRREWNVQRPETYVARVKSPPYVSNVPDVHHYPLPKGAPGQQRDLFLISCSDGLADLYDGQTRPDMIHRWVTVVGRSIENRTRGNLALSLLRDGLGGADIRLVSQKLTVEMEEKWMDDVTIIVQRLF
jgi:pyruvate dehydrogenase phosphatase